MTKQNIELATVDQTARRSARRATILALLAIGAALVGTTTLGWFSWWVSA